MSLYHEPESIFDFISNLGREHIQMEMNENEMNQKDDSLKTTSLRLSQMQLTALDAVCKGLDMSRNQAMQLAVRQFIGDSVAGYAIGRASAYADGDENAAGKEMTVFLDGLNLDTDTRKYIANLATDVFVVKMGIV